MALISERDQAFLRDKFAADLVGPVKMVFFTQGQSPLMVPSKECEFCEDTLLLLEEVTALSDKISMETHDFVAEAELAKTYRVDKIPATIIVGNQNHHGGRFFGVPSGYEFASLIEDIIAVSQ